MSSEGPASSAESATDPRFTLGPWVVDPRLDQIEADGRVVKLEPRTMRLLAVLAQARGALVTTEQLMDGVWTGLVVTTSSLYEAVALLRRALGTDAGGGQAVVSVPRKGYRLRWPVGRPEGPALGGKSIAVLPFRARRLPEALDFVSESLTADLIGELSRQPDWLIVARGTMMTYAAQAMASPEVGRQLGARFVVEGSVELIDDELVVTVQVIDVPSGTQTWAETIQLPLSSWDAAARTVVARLSRALKFEVLQIMTRSASPADGPIAQARILASRAWVELFARPESAATNERALHWARQAHAADPALALASVCLATCHWRAAQFGWFADEPATLLDMAAGHAERAVAIDPQDPDAHYVHGLVAYGRGETARAEESLRHCIRLSASFAPAYGLLALVRTRRGFPEEAASWCGRAFATSPREPLRAVWHLARAWAALAQSDFRTALEESQRSMAVNPDFATCYLPGAAAAHALGLTELSTAWTRRLHERTVFKSLQAVRERMPPATEPAHRQQMDALVGWLRGAGLQE